MKTPEEIKKGLELCVNADSCDYPCDECPYVEDDDGCKSMMEDALALIQRLEVNDSQVRKALQDNGFQTLEELLQAYSQVKRERDAAVADLNCNWKCAICKRFTKPIDKCPHYGECGLGYRNFEWRGVPEKEKNEPIRAD